MRISDCVIFLPGGSRQGQSRQCWGRGCLCYLRQLASGSQGTQNHLRRAEDNSETKTKWWWWGWIDGGNLNLNEFKVSLPGSDSSAKAMICSPSTSSSCGKNEDKLNSLVWTCYTRNSGIVFPVFSLFFKFLPRCHTCCVVAASSGLVLKSTEE